MHSDSLIFIPKSKPNARLRLLCFSYAGGSAASYIPWVHDIHSDVELAVIQLPGRGALFNQKPFTSMQEMVSNIFNALNKLTPKDTIFYGHSMGARVAYELCLLLLRWNVPLPIQVIASGSAHPKRELKSPTHYNLPDDEFIDYLRGMSESSVDVFSNPEILELSMPILRADFEIIETYCSNSNIKLPLNVVLFAGKEDKIDIEDLSPWFDLFQSNSGITWITGGHFFVDHRRNEVIHHLNIILQSTLDDLNKTNILEHNLELAP